MTEDTSTPIQDPDENDSSVEAGNIVNEILLAHKEKWNGDDEIQDMLAEAFVKGVKFTRKQYDEPQDQFVPTNQGGETIIHKVKAEPQEATDDQIRKALSKGEYGVLNSSFSVFETPLPQEAQTLERLLHDKLWKFGVWDDLTHDQHVELKQAIQHLMKLEKEKLIDTITSLSSYGERASYLPPNYDHIKSWPITQEPTYLIPARILEELRGEK